jgi:hypothetical protein
LVNEGGEDLRVAVTLIQRGIGAHTVEIAPAGNVPQPNALGALDDKIERSVVMGAVALFFGDQFARTL